jgi:hypothetical protein
MGISAANDSTGLGAVLRHIRWRIVVTLMIAMTTAPAVATEGIEDAAPAVTSGKFFAGAPTLVSLGFEWVIQGDGNRNARVEVAYRIKGERAYRTGLTMLRLQRERVPEAKFAPFAYIAPNAFAGSIFGLKPGTEYECRFTLTDPDGVSGEAVKLVTIRTRAEPVPATGGRVFHVYPPGYKGARIEPSFTGLLEAYYTGSSHGDSYNSYPPRVRPGDVILVHAGLYKDDWRHYGGLLPGQIGLGTVGTGTYMLTQAGTADRPIVIKGAGDGEAIFDGDGSPNLFNVLAGSYTYFEGITIRNTDLAILAGYKRITGASGITVKSVRFEDVGRALFSDWRESRDFYIADNIVIGRNPPGKLLGWIGKTWEKFPGFPQPLRSEFAFKVYGQGNVIAYNTVRRTHDGIDFATYGPPDGDTEEDLPGYTDIYGNDISETDDDCIEADGAARNIRVFENRCFNNAADGLSAQPIFGGPAYFIRNVVYNAVDRGAVKWAPGPAGLLYFNNTFFAELGSMSPASNVQLVNNLFLGQNRDLPVYSVQTFTPYSVSDYNGFAPAPQAKQPFAWTIQTGSKPVPPASFADLSSYTAATGQDRHSRTVDYRMFVGVSPVDRLDVQRVYDPATVDFRLTRRASAVDGGTIIPNVTDNYRGRAPDLGAVEFGDPLPHYGSRTLALRAEGE